jgi:hypothetical protein
MKGDFANSETASGPSWPQSMAISNRTRRRGVSYRALLAIRHGHSEVGVGGVSRSTADRQRYKKGDR